MHLLNRKQPPSTTTYSRRPPVLHRPTSRLRRLSLSDLSAASLVERPFRRRRRHPRLLHRARPPSFNNLAHKVITHLRNSSIPILPPLQLRISPRRGRVRLLLPPDLGAVLSVGLPISPASRGARPPPPASNSSLLDLPISITSSITDRPYSLADPNREKERAGRKGGGGGWPAVDDDATLLMVGAHCREDERREEKERREERERRRRRRETAGMGRRRRDGAAPAHGQWLLSADARPAARTAAARGDAEAADEVARL
ncbi:hypothetical protein Scep_010038 [Stephania cephalantha]|uniref:Uncharacterized protein n=1 Tax=Stephania cephalantha TaxID=152367 RepID=A0AAP0JWR5_9MAGN